MIVDFIHWSQSVFSRLRCGGGEIFSQHALQTGHKCTSFRVNHYLCPQRPLSPSSILPLLPPSFSHTVTSTLPSLPFFYYVPIFFFSFSKVYYWENITPSIVCTNVHLHTSAELPAQLLFPNQKQTAINRAPSLLSHTGDSLNQSVFSWCSAHPGLCYPFSESSSCVCVYIFLKVASNDKDLAPLQTQ